MEHMDMIHTVIYDTVNMLKISQTLLMPENVCDKLPELSIRNSMLDLVFTFFTVEMSICGSLNNATEDSNSNSRHQGSR